MDLLERYITEVGRYLPRKGREDVKNELRSTLEDMLDERVVEGKPTEADVEALLREYGSPQKVAASYGSEQYVIGPDLYPFFVMVTKFGLMGITIALVIAFTVGLFGSTMGLADLGLAVLGLVGQLFTAALSFLGSVLIVMMILQRYGIKPEIGEKDKEWHPRSLPAVDDPFRFSQAEMIISIVFTGLWILILNYFWMQGGIVVSVTLPLQATVIAVPPVYFIVLIVIALLQIAVQVVVMRQGGWTIPTRAARLMFELASFYVSYLVIGVVIAWIVVQPWAGEPLNDMLTWGYRLYPLLALLIILAAVVDIVKMVFKANPGLQEMLVEENNSTK
ncbi:MAG: hypothetical protein JXJ17_08765 [Anaerolineae bacterium]|nr:hypothetical protein [Anaerolineae bacterium]